MRRTKKTKKTRMQGHMAVAISMAMAAGLALTGCGSTGTTGVSAETSAGGKNEAGISSFSAKENTWVLSA